MVGRLGHAVLEFVFPSRCLGCSRSGSFLCDVCVDALPRADSPRCWRCWRLQSRFEVCPECHGAPPPFDSLRSAFVYQGTVCQLVRGLKYRGITGQAVLYMLRKRAEQASVQAFSPHDLRRLVFR